MAEPKPPWRRDNGSVIWMDVSKDNQGIDGAADIRVQHATIGRKKQKRIHCKVRLHDKDGKVLQMDCGEGDTMPFPRWQKNLKPEGTTNKVEHFYNQLKQEAMAVFRQKKRDRAEMQREDSERDGAAAGTSVAAACDPPFSSPRSPLLSLPCLFLFCSAPADGQRRTKRTAKAADVMNMGSGALYPSRQTGSAHSSVPAPPQKAALESAVAGLLNIP